MNFGDFFCFEANVPVLQAHERDGVVSELVASLDKAGMIGQGNASKITQAVIKRENEASTGMGKGVAVPHVKHKAIKNIVAVIGQSNIGIDFCALDKKPVYSVILLLSPVDNPDKHLQAMEQIFKHLQSDKFRSFLRQSDTTGKMKDLLQEADTSEYL